jgi:dGTPase
LETLDGVRNHSWRRPTPNTPEGEVVAWADRIAYVCHDFEDAVRAGILTSADLPAAVADIVGADRRSQLAGFVHGLLHGIDRTGHVSMTAPEADALAAFREFNFDRVYLRPAARRQAERVIGLLRGIVDYYLDTPSRLPADATDVHAGLAPGGKETAAAVVRYVSGMTDRYALGLGVELLGWRLDELPRGV